MQIIDANLVVKGLAEVPDIRVRTKYWMRIGGLFVVTFIFLQLLVTYAVIPIGLYRTILFGMSMLWPYVVYGMMPASVDPSMPPIYRMIRKWIPPSQWCWVIGFTFWFVFHVPTTRGTLDGNLGEYFPTIALHAVAGFGLIGLLFWLHDLALRLDLHSAAQQCNIVAFTMATWGVIVFVAPWKQFTAGNLQGGDQTVLYWFYIVVLMTVWFYVLHLFARALFEFASDSRWSLSHEQGKEGRLERIREKREQYDREHGH